MRCWLTAARAEMHAHLGDRDAARRGFDQAERLLPADSDDPAMPYLSLNITHLARWRLTAWRCWANPKPSTTSPAHSMTTIPTSCARNAPCTPIWRTPCTPPGNAARPATTPCSPNSSPPKSVRSATAAA